MYEFNLVRFLIILVLLISINYWWQKRKKKKEAEKNTLRGINYDRRTKGR